MSPTPSPGVTTARERTRPHLLTLVDLAATAVFAIGGAQAGVDADLDVFGLMVVAFATALGGGMIRDVLIGDTPPAALRSVAYPVVAFCGAGAVFLVERSVDEIPSSLMDTLDAGGLSLFCVVGAAKALDHDLRPLAAVLLGTITAVGGGVIRDVLVDVVPSVLRADVYATAAVIGSAVMVALSVRGVRRPRAMLVGAVACFVVRMMSLWFDWELPRAIGR
ncbi:MAG: trimeric intracellular cation channel family protein [Ilumatobacteraceae bacterium]